MSQPEMDIIAFAAVCKSYSQTQALVDFTYAFAKNAITAIVGRSGSGKSTILKLINGLERPTAGTVSVLGAPLDYSRIAGFRRKLGYAVQGTGLFPHMTVRQNIALQGALAGWAEEEKRARTRELMQLTGLEGELADRYPHELSGGQQQRVGLCRAMFLDPAIFLLDEPFGALDPITRTELHDEFLRLQKTVPRTIVLVTHDMREAMKLADRILILEQGRLVQEGACDTILRSPATPFVEELIHTQLD